MNITRYNRSFIGLMEMCTSGAWCKWRDVDRCLKFKEDELNAHKRYSQHYQDAYTKLYLSVNNPKHRVLKIYLKIIFGISLVCNLILAAKLDGVL